MRVPNKYAAGFWPSLILGILAVTHAFVLLLQYWSVSFNIWINYQEINAERVELPDSMSEVDLENDTENEDPTKTFGTRQILEVPKDLPTHARICPAKGKHVLVELEYFPVLGMTFSHHRRRYCYDRDNQIWTKIRCRVDFDVSVLDVYSGFANQVRLVHGQIRYGPNIFQVKQPSFGELYRAQLLNPFSVFQIFCVLLWAIDDYLVYSFFSLGMVLMFEGTVVFQRLKSMQMLQGMGNPARLVYVFRSGNWTQVDSTVLLPGDILSLTRVAPHVTTDDRKIRSIEDDGGDVVPADVLLLRGSTVVNEASLTGESVPQMKEGLAELEPEPLSMKHKHKMNVAFAGTKMLQCRGSEEITTFSHIPPPPDNGCVCFVLRTGFASAQGKLVRMIEGSQEKVKGHEKETGLLLLLLCFFAICSSSYVLYHGVQDENRSKYELLLHCILIVTSVIRPELPMQMAMAVNNSLMTLMKMHVFCTEPYRVPTAGKLDSCLFDKTGTLTTDELVAVGVCQPKDLTRKVEDGIKLLTPMGKLSNQAAALVLAGCHSLVVYNDETTGDPLESASIKAMDWHLDSEGRAVPAPAKGSRSAGTSLSWPGGPTVSSVEILGRHHFSSKLQRMSCVVKTNGGHLFAVAKGSPEAIGRLLESQPDGYKEQSEFLAKQGYRVIALAYKSLLSAEEAKETRAACESNLTFCGFVAFTCMVRKDTASVLFKLKEGGMSIAMVTGDALLTAIHVAKQVDICEPVSGGNVYDSVSDEKNEELKEFIREKRKEKGIVDSEEKVYRPIAYLAKTEKSFLIWKSYENDEKVSDFVAADIPRLSETHDLALTGKSLTAAMEQDDDMSKVLQHIKVFARMAPDAKETVIQCLHSVGLLTLFAGDGANDVGALKSSDVGVALLTGFGNVNVEKAEDDIKKKEDDKKKVTATITKDHMDKIRGLPLSLIKGKIRAFGCEPDKFPGLVDKEDILKLYEIKAREYAVKQHETKAKKNNLKKSKQELTSEKMEKVQQRVAELEAQGVQFAQFKAMQEFWKEESAAARKASKNRGIEGSAASLASQLDDLDTGDVPMVKLGDASIAAPFTSKMPSIRSCVDIVRQGRCTLVSTIQMVSHPLHEECNCMFTHF